MACVRCSRMMRGGSYMTFLSSLEMTSSERVSCVMLSVQILGPVLFIIYINDLVEHCDFGSDIFLFADDAKIFSN